jgi:hypothetical protein
MTGGPPEVLSRVREGEVLAGKYRVERVIGQGGMGVVVVAQHLELGQRVAVKFLLPEACDHPDAVARFLREARAAVQIQSEHDGQPLPTSVEPRATSQSALRPIGLVTAGLGIVGLGVGSFFGLQAMGKKSDAGCTADKLCPDEPAANTFRDAASAGNLSTIFFVAGGVLAAGGLTMWLVAPKPEAPTVATQAIPSVGMRTAGMALAGRW